MTGPATTSADSSSNGAALSDVLDTFEATLEGDHVRVAEIVDGFGGRSFPAFMLLPALIVASPASGIPGVTGMGGMIVAMAAVQMFLARESLWLPGFITRRQIPVRHLERALRWLRPMVRVVERHTRQRLTVLTRPPLVLVPQLIILLIVLCMPVMELMPLSGSIAGGAISIFAVGLLLRDGLLLLLLVALAVALAIPWFIWQFF